MSTQVTRDKKHIHKIMEQHVGHDVNITQHDNHTYLWCTTCTEGNEQFVDSVGNQKYLVLKTYDRGTFVAFFINRTDQEPVDRVMGT